MGVWLVEVFVWGVFCWLDGVSMVMGFGFLVFGFNEKFKIWKFEDLLEIGEFIQVGEVC